jgi:hypothetical protein
LARKNEVRNSQAIALAFEIAAAAVIWGDCARDVGTADSARVFRSVAFWTATDLDMKLIAFREYHKGVAASFCLSVKGGNSIDS